VPSPASGGTLATFINSLSGRELYKSRLGFDPLMKSPSGAKSPAVLNVNTQSFMGYDNASQQWVGPFVMAAVMANCIRRSNVIKKYSDKLGYYEAQVYPNFMAAFVATVLTIAIGICIIIVPIRWLFLALGVLPAPGDGPSKEKMDEGFLKVTTLATGASGVCDFLIALASAWC
jgi:short subunit dehydrogenase-like uncharacterized protein